MTVLQIPEPGRAEWREAPDPEPGPGEILLDVSGVTTCPHWDLHVFDGEPMFADRPFAYPYVAGEPGHEAVGRVAVLGDGVDDLALGQRVAVWRDPGGRRQGCYASLAPVEAAHVLPVPEALDDSDLAPLELAMCVQVTFDQLAERGGVGGARVGVSGLGPAGLIAVQLAKANGAREVVAIDPVPERRALGRELGADRVLPPERGRFSAGRAGASACDVAIDTTGLVSAIEFLIERTADTVALFGVLREPVRFPPSHWWGGFALLGYGEHNRAAAERALGRVVEGSLRLGPLVTHTLPLSRYAEGVERLRRKEAIKILFVPE